MKVAYVGDMVNHGHMLTTVGSSLIFLLSKLQTVDSIDIYCPIKNDQEKLDFLPKNVVIAQTYTYDDFLTLLRLLRGNFSRYDKVIFNILPTGAGTSTIANAFLMLLPILVKLLKRQSKVIIVYHNSIFINNVKALGYKGLFNAIRGHILRIVETFYFKHIDTFFLLKLYKDIIDNAIPNNRVKVINAQYLEAYATVMLNRLDNLDTINQKSSEKAKKILLHGYWGPQKNLEGALSMLSTLVDNGLNCRIIISGGLNRHFREYQNYFNSVLQRFHNYIETYKGYVEEEEMVSLLMNSDLIILPYNTPGGHSGVLEQAIFFGVPTIAMDFLEYREQSENAKNVHLVSNMDEMAKETLHILRKINNTTERRVQVKNRIDSSLQTISLLLF